MKKLTLLFSLTLAGFSLCAQTFVSTVPENRNAVLEEFTGIHCTFCPDGHRLAQLLHDANPNDVVLINVHVGGYATPDAGEPDFRTAFGTALAGQSGLCGYPAGTVNRQYFPGLSQTDNNNQPCGTNAIAMSRGDWTGAANQILDESSPVNVAARATIDMVGRTLTVVVEAYYTGNSATATNKLTVAVTENNLESNQTGASANPSQILPNGKYNHKHMLRHFLTGQWGATISNTSAGSFFTDTYTWDIPADLHEIPIKVADLEVSVFIAEGNKDIITGDMAELTLVSANAYDALPYIVSVPEYVCGNELESSVTIQNFGNETMTSLDILYSVNAGSVSTYEWTGSLTTGQTEVVSLPNITFSSIPTNTLWIHTVNPNGQGDQLISNDIQLVEFLPAKNSNSEVTITIKTDNYGSETSWLLKGSNGNTIGSGGPYTNVSGGQTFTEDFTLELGCYEFIINDGFGDGMCCNYGNGSYTISDNNGNVLTGASFGAQELKPFNVGDGVGIEEVEILSGLSVYPNPFALDATVRFQLAQNTKVALSVYNVLGKSVLNREMGQMAAGEHNLKLSSEGFASGMYLVTLTVGGQQQTSRISISK